MAGKITTRIVECNKDFNDPLRTLEWFVGIVERLPGVHIIKTIYHVFPTGDMTGLVLLAESHAAIHTWPEEGYAWCELATCGDPKDCDLFESLIKWQEGRF